MLVQDRQRNEILYSGGHIPWCCRHYFFARHYVWLRVWLQSFQSTTCYRFFPTCYILFVREEILFISLFGIFQKVCCCYLILSWYRESYLLKFPSFLFCYFGIAPDIKVINISLDILKGMWLLWCFKEGMSDKRTRYFCFGWCLNLVRYYSEWLIKVEFRIVICLTYNLKTSFMLLTNMMGA